MDTDSAYIAISGDNLKDIIKPNMKTTFEKSLTGFCSKSEIKTDALYHWLLRTCCIYIYIYVFIHLHIEVHVLYMVYSKDNTNTISIITDK